MRNPEKPSNSPGFCADESVQRRENILGTAAIAPSYLLIEKHGFWPQRASQYLEDVEFSSELNTQLAEFAAACRDDIRIVLVKRERLERKIKVALFRTKISAGKEYEIDRHGDLLDIDLIRAYEEVGPVDDLALVCTHGKRDRCCAKFGLPVVQELRRSAQEATSKRLRVWESTHVGGDRFAANVVWLPHGYVFGHCQLDTTEFARKLLSNQISIKHLRGRSTLVSAAQFAEGKIRQSENFYSVTRVEVASFNTLEEGENANVGIYSLDLVFGQKEPSVYSATVSIRYFEECDRVTASCSLNTKVVPRKFELLELKKT